MTQQPTMLTQDLVERLATSRARFVEFVEQRVSDPELAEDIVQESLLKAIRSAPALRDEERLMPWFYRILRNAIIDSYRHRAAVDRRVSREPLPDLPELPEDEAIVCECLYEILPALRPEYADLIRRLDLDEQSTATVAEDLGITANNLKVRRHRARRALKERLEEACRVCAEHGCLDCTCGGGHPPT